MFETAKDYTITAGVFAIFYVGLPAAWLRGLFQAVEDGSFLWFTVNVMIPPVGIINGLIQWFG